MRRYILTLFVAALFATERLAAASPRLLDGFLSPLTIVVLFVRAFIFRVLAALGYYGYRRPSALVDSPSWTEWLIAFVLILVFVFVLTYIVVLVGRRWHHSR